MYYCIFLAKNPDDQGKGNEFSRWWPECYAYTNSKNRKKYTQSTHFNHPGCMEIQQEVYEMGYIPPVNINPKE